MTKIPEFALYGEDDPKIEEALQGSLSLRGWDDLSKSEKQIALQDMSNNGWLENYSPQILSTVDYLNYTYLRECPGKNLHDVKPTVKTYSHEYDNTSERMTAALADFHNIFMNGTEIMVLRMLSKFVSGYIDTFEYGRAENAQDEASRQRFINDAFRRFDSVANCLNHIFEQFAVNQVVTRSGFMPRQDEKITEEIYEPTLKVLANPQWKTVSADLAKMFEDYREKNYPECITKAHGAVQRFLQILAGEEGKDSKGEVGKLFEEAKDKGLIPINRFTEPIINAIQGFIVSERATNSTAKPTLKEATASDALLVMNVVMVLLQHCLQNLT
jgi:hypothetical protein